MHASVANHYFEGGYFPEGGPGMFAREIIPTIEAAGGRCLVAKKVDKILVKKGRAYGVQMEVSLSSTLLRLVHFSFKSDGLMFA